jgi:hypothetical protein
MLYLREIEAQLVERLTPLQAEHLFHLYNAPDTRNVLNPQAKALVFFAGQSLSEPQVEQVPIPGRRQIRLYQEGNLRWSVSLQLVNLQTHTPVYPLIEAIQAALAGFYPLTDLGSFSCFVPEDINFRSLKDGAAWQYILNFSLRKFAR